MVDLPTTEIIEPFFVAFSDKPSGIDRSKALISIRSNKNNTSRFFYLRKQKKT